MKFKSTKMIRRGKSITGKPVGPNASNLKRIKPSKTRKIIRRYHFLLARKKNILRILHIEDDNDHNTQQLLKNNSLFKEGWDLRGNDLNIKDEGVESLLLNSYNKASMEILFKCLGYISREINNEGGLANYQIASKMGQDQNRGGDSSKLLVEWMKELTNEKMSALEIGSLSNKNKISTSGIFKPVTRIDLNNSNDSEGIIRQDFMKRPLPKTVEEKFDLISCSLVLNFVPTPLGRGQMCQRFQEFLKNDGYVFIVLPLPCISNSRYMNKQHFDGIMDSLGYTNIRYHEAKKVCYFLYKLTHTPFKKTKNIFQKKQKLQDGSTMNNFSIILS